MGAEGFTRDSNLLQEPVSVKPLYSARMKATSQTSAAEGSGPVVSVSRKRTLVEPFSMVLKRSGLLFITSILTDGKPPAKPRFFDNEVTVLLQYGR